MGTAIRNLKFSADNVLVVNYMSINKMQICHVTFEKRAGVARRSAFLLTNCLRGPLLHI